MRFVDFLRTTVMLSAAAATALGAVTVAGLSSRGDTLLTALTIGWWAVAWLMGMWSGRHQQATQAIGRLLATARTTNAIPEQRPGMILLNRLWPLLLVTVVAGALAFLAPQVPGVFAGGGLLLSMYFRRQDAAVAAIEDRDGVRFYVRRTSPLRPIALDRTPGFRAVLPRELNGAA
jgi:hypothetical protein